MDSNYKNLVLGCQNPGSRARLTTGQAAKNYGV